ncbi:MAG: hypothetical protein ACQEQL_08680 [Pseudomonadota bacterium]
MLFSRPDIRPLNWDLKELPVPDGSRNHAAYTSEGWQLDFRFSGGWLTVSLDKDATGDLQNMTVIIEKHIAPFGTTKIFPEQLCDICGLTVQGEKQSVSVERVNASNVSSRYYIDLSGTTTYWKSHHLTMLHDDLDDFLSQAENLYPDMVLLQSKLSLNDDKYVVKWREIEFLLNTDEHVNIGIGSSQPEIKTMVKNNKLSFPFLIHINCGTLRSDVTGKTWVENHLKREGTDLDYNVINHRRIHIWVEYRTDDVYAQDCMKKLISLINDFFVSEFYLVNIKNPDRVKGPYTDHYILPSYSKALRDWCLQKKNRFIKINYALKPSENPHEENNKKAVFYGFKPFTTKKILGFNKTKKIKKGCNLEKVIKTLY